MVGLIGTGVHCTDYSYQYL